MNCSWMTGLEDTEKIQCRFQGLLFPVAVFHLADYGMINKEIIAPFVLFFNIFCQQTSRLRESIHVNAGLLKLF